MSMTMKAAVVHADVIHTASLCMTSVCTAAVCMLNRGIVPSNELASHTLTS